MQRTASSSKALASLARLLNRAAADGFAAVMADSLGDELREGSQRCLKATARGQSPDPELVGFRADLDGFDRLGRHDRSRIVALGLRLVRMLRVDEPAQPVPLEQPEDSESVTVLQGVGPSTAKKLAARGLGSVEDLAYLLPVRYEDRRVRKPLAELADGDLGVLEVVVEKFRQGFFRGRFMATMEARVEGAAPVGRIQARWFHRVGGLAQRAAVGSRVLLVGPVKQFRGRSSMVHPEIYDPDKGCQPIAVRYPVVAGIGQGTLARLCRAALERLAHTEGGLRDSLPPSVARSEGLPSQLEALRELHAPDEDLSADRLEALQHGRSLAHRRLAFDELFVLQLALLRERERWRQLPCALPELPEGAADAETLRACIPFEPTHAQSRALREVWSDLGSGRPMLRLLQGDVGSGKTVVAFGAALAVAHAGAQAAIMAPTEVLAEQHVRTLRPWCERAGLRLDSLTGRMGRAERASLLALLAAGRIDVLVGTHALLVGDVQFANLGLAVIDEQHRFGVEQRTLLRDKGRAPHLLVMTATPIPRTMTLAAYGELDVSVLDELPPGREPPATQLFTGKRGLDRARRALVRAVEDGAQVFVVCPLVEASEVLDVSDVEAAAADLRGRMPDRRVDVVHGRLTAAERDPVMTRFRSGETDVLVATTVIEVGVDMPSARAILVEHAERFGLAQVHQLRGRVGRGGGESLCLLHTAHSPSSDAGQRLRVLVETGDGFEVAERDLENRGPGEMFGTRQAGVPRLRFTGFAGEGLRIMVAARDAARRLLEGDPGLEQHPDLRVEIARRTDARPIFTAESG